MRIRDELAIKECKWRVDETVSAIEKKARLSSSPEDMARLLSTELTYHISILAVLAKASMEGSGDEGAAYTKSFIIDMILERLNE